MTLTLYGHPFSSYCQKALIALYENDMAFEFRVLGTDEKLAREFAALWPLQRFPVLVDEGRTVIEATIIIEHLGLRHPRSVRLIPENPIAALDTRMMDRFFDNYVMTPTAKIVTDAIRPSDLRDAHGVGEARAMLETAYSWLDAYMADREWAAGDGFSLADCAAAPSLFYADWTHPVAEEFRNVHSYRQRLIARPAFARAIDEARPYRAFFPLGAPDRD